MMRRPEVRENLACSTYQKKTSVTGVLSRDGGLQDVGLYLLIGSVLCRAREGLIENYSLVHTLQGLLYTCEASKCRKKGEQLFFGLSLQLPPP